MLVRYRRSNAAENQAWGDYVLHDPKDYRKRMQESWRDGYHVDVQIAPRYLTALLQTARLATATEHHAWLPRS